MVMSPLADCLFKDNPKLNILAESKNDQITQAQMAPILEKIVIDKKISEKEKKFPAPKI